MSRYVYCLIPIRWESAKGKATQNSRSSSGSQDSAGREWVGKTQGNFSWRSCSVGSCDGGYTPDTSAKIWRILLHKSESWRIPGSDLYCNKRISMYYRGVKGPHWRTGGGALVSTFGNGLRKTEGKGSRPGALHYSSESSSLGMTGSQFPPALQLNK